MRMMTRFVFCSLITAMLLLLVGCNGASKTDADTLNPGGVYAFWPPLPDEPRIQFLTSFRFSSDVEADRTALDKLIFGSAEQRLAIGKPYGVAMWNGRIYVCDLAGDRGSVVILDLRKRQTRVMGVTGSPALLRPVDIAIADDGMKYVVDRQLGRIFVFDADDRQVAVLGWRDFSPVAVAVRGDELYVPDFREKRVIVMDRHTGERLRSIGEPGGGDGQFIGPLGIEVDDEGNVYVTDVINSRLQKFSPDGELLMVTGQIANTAGNFVRPKHIAVDREGIIYVVDAAFQNVQMFNPDGEILMYFGSPGSHPGAMDLPAGIDIHESDFDLFESYVHPGFEIKRLLLVTNQFGLRKVSVYAMGGLKEGWTTDDIAPSAAEISSGTTDDPTGGLPPAPEAGDAETNEQE